MARDYDYDDCTLLRELPVGNSQSQNYTNIYLLQSYEYPTMINSTDVAFEHINKIFKSITLCLNNLPL